MLRVFSLADCTWGPGCFTASKIKDKLHVYNTQDINKCEHAHTHTHTKKLSHVKHMIWCACEWVEIVVDGNTGPAAALIRRLLLLPYFWVWIVRHRPLELEAEATVLHLQQCHSERVNPCPSMFCLPTSERIRQKTSQGPASWCARLSCAQPKPYSRTRVRRTALWSWPDTPVYRLAIESRCVCARGRVFVGSQ